MVETRTPRCDCFNRLGCQRLELHYNPAAILVPTSTERFFAMPPLLERPFSWKCPTCHERSIVRSIVPYTIECAHDGRTYTVSIPDLAVPRCEKCGDMIFDTPATRRIDQALREQIGLLSPSKSAKTVKPSDSRKSNSAVAIPRND